MTGVPVHWFGDRAVVVPMPDPHERIALLAAATQEFGALRVRAGMDSVMVLAVEPDPRLRHDVADWLAGAVLDMGDADASAPTVEIAVDYDGPDLDATATTTPSVARRTACSATTSSSWMTEPSTPRGTSVPSGA